MESLYYGLFERQSDGKSDGVLILECFRTREDYEVKSRAENFYCEGYGLIHAIKTMRSVNKERRHERDIFDKEDDKF